VANENLTTFTEVDSNSVVTVSDNLITTTNAQYQHEYLVYKDRGENYYAGDFEHTVAVRSTSTTAHLCFWGLSNAADDFADIVAASGDCLYAIDVGISRFFFLYEIDGGTAYYDNSAGTTADAWYYHEIERDESTGTYGTLLCRIYSDDARTNLLDTLSITLHKKADFRYVHALNSVKEEDQPQKSGEVKDFYAGGIYATGTPTFPAATADGTAEGLTGYLTFDATGAVEFPALIAEGDAAKRVGYLTFDAYESVECMSVTADTVTITDAQLGYQYRLTKDLGAAYFDGNFTHTVQAKFIRGSTGYWRGAFWGLSNAAQDFYQIDADGGYALWIGAEGNNSGTWRICLTECNAGTLYQSSSALVADNTDYYYTITRNESVGTYGLLSAYIYSDPGRTSLVATLSLGLHYPKQDFRYLHGANSNYISYNTNTYSAQFKDLDFGYHSYVAATGAATFPLLACDADVDTPYKGVIGAPEFPLLASEGAVVLSHTCEGEPSFPALRPDGVATPHWFFGPGEVDFPLLAAYGTVHVNPKHAVGAPEFPLLTASGIAIRPIRGAGVATFPLLEADGGQIIKDTATGAATFPAAAASGAAKRKVKATSTPSFPALEADMVAAKTITATGAPTLPKARAQGYSLDYDKHAGSGTPTLPAARASGKTKLYPKRTATGAGTLPAARANGAAKLYYKRTGSGAGTLPAARASGRATVYRLRTATGTMTFRALTAAGAGTSRRIAGAATFGALATVGAAKRKVTATGASEFPALTSSSSGQRVYTGTGDVTFAAALAEGAAGRTISASGTITFPALTAGGATYRIVYGEGTPAFEALETSVTTARTVHASGTPSFPVPYGGMHAFNATERALQWYRVVQVTHIGNEPYKRAKLEAVRAPVMR